MLSRWGADDIKCECEDLTFTTGAGKQKQPILLLVWSPLRVKGTNDDWPTTREWSTLKKWHMYITTQKTREKMCMV